MYSIYNILNVVLTFNLYSRYVLLLVFDCYITINIISSCPRLIIAGLQSLMRFNQTSPSKNVCFRLASLHSCTETLHGVY